MILIISHKEDYTTDYVINKLNQSGISYFRFNCEDIFNYDISIRINEVSKVLINNHFDFKSVWYRRIKLPNIGLNNSEENLYLLQECNSFLKNLLSLLNVKWVSNPNAIDYAENKLVQLTLAYKLGFQVPDTLVTTNKKEVSEFVERNESSIIKPIGHGRIQYGNDNAKLIFTNIFPREMLSNLDNYILTPSIFQEQIKKQYELRVTVIGQNVFAAKVDSQSDNETLTDWRRKKLKFTPYDLPASLKTKCIMLLKELGLQFGAIDIIRNNKGEYIFLEINPNGQWVWIENDTKQPIAETLIKELLC